MQQQIEMFARRIDQ
jgi:hypothetical protein